MKLGLHPNTRSTLGETLPTAGRRGNDILERARGLVPLSLLTTDCGRPWSEMWWRATDNADNRHPPDHRAATNIDLVECRLRGLPTTTTTSRTPVIAGTTIWTHNSGRIESGTTIDQNILPGATATTVGEWCESTTYDLRPSAPTRLDDDILIFWPTIGE